MLVCAPAARAGLVPGGGGNPTSDCYAELDVAGVENGTDAVKHGRKVLCADGDPCDGGPCGDGVCDFQVRLCWDQNDPALPECVPPTTLDTLLLRGPLAALLVMPRSVAGTDCNGAYVDLAVPTKANGTKPGRLTVRMSAKAPPGTTPLVDTDLIRLVCVPRPVDECPVPTSTTTTTPSGTTFTPTTLGGVPTTTIRTTTSTTLRRPRKTTTTIRLPLPTTSTIGIPTTLLPTTLLPTTTVTTTTARPPTTAVPTTTPTTANTTTTTLKRRHGGGDGDNNVVINLGL